MTCFFYEISRKLDEIMVVYAVLSASDTNLTPVIDSHVYNLHRKCKKNRSQPTKASENQKIFVKFIIDIKQILLVQKLWELTIAIGSHSITFTYSSRHSSKFSLLIV